MTARLTHEILTEREEIIVFTGTHINALRLAHKISRDLKHTPQSGVACVKLEHYYGSWSYYQVNCDGEIFNITPDMSHYADLVQDFRNAEEWAKENA